MKSLRRLCVASLLTFTFSLSVFAGQMSTTVVQPAPTNATTTGEMSATEEAAVISSVAEAALNLLQSVLSLL
jgi:hypothetical protein